MMPSIFFNEMKSNLKLDPNNDSEDFEEALKNLGRLLGFYSIRPEKEKMRVQIICGYLRIIFVL